MSIDDEVFVENKPRVHAACLVVVIRHLAGAFIDSHHSNIRTAPQRFLQPGDCIVRKGIRAARTRIDIHHPNRQSSNCACEPGSPIERHLLPGIWIDPDLPAEK